MAPKKSKRGGARAGAGRKPSPAGKAKKISITLPGPLAEKLEAWAAEKKLTRSEAIAAAVQRLVARRPS